MDDHTTEEWWTCFSILTPPYTLLIRTFQHIKQCSQTLSCLTPSLWKKLDEISTRCNLPLAVARAQKPWVAKLLLNSMVWGWLYCLCGSQCWGNRRFIYFYRTTSELRKAGGMVLLGCEVAVCGLLGMLSLKGKENWEEGLMHLVY